ncbi:MAG: NUDIX hydrolase [Catonella sp.]|jgi:ADP-ribose pyrophosphatase|nr:NUDIX hydrolase [Catonella sp.]MDY6356680.1 NUDIX hydrolase [Catonella sp.]
MNLENRAKITDAHEESFDRFHVVVENVELDGETHPFSYIKLQEGVCILPFLGDKILIACEYRYPINSWQWELPGGGIEKFDTDLFAAAKRELHEETGYMCDRFENLGYFYPSFGSTDEKINLIAAFIDDGTERKPDFDITEQIEHKLITKDEFRKMVGSEEFCHAAGIAAWLRYCAKHGEKAL